MPRSQHHVSGQLVLSLACTQKLTHLHADTESHANLHSKDAGAEDALLGTTWPDMDSLIPEVPSTTAPPTGIFQVLSQIDESLWENLAPRQRSQLWDKVVGSVQSSLISPELVPSVSLPENAPVATGIEKSNGPSGNGAAVSDSSNGKPGNSGRPRIKRRRDVEDNEEDQNDGDNEEDQNNGDNKEPRQPRKAAKVDRSSMRLFACPFRKMYPWIFIHEPRCLGGWPDTNRLKYVTRFPSHRLSNRQN